MFTSYIVFVVLLVGASSRHLQQEDIVPVYVDEDGELYQPVPISHHLPEENIRVRRQAHGSFTMNSDGTSGAAVKVPFAGNDRNILSAIGSVDLNRNMHMGAATGGIAYDNINGHGASLTNTHIPGFGDKLTAAGKVNLFHNDHHDLTGTAFATRNMPSIPQVPNFNTVGGRMDYMFNNKIGASASAAHTDLLKRNDYSLGGNLNLFRNPTTSLDFNAGMKKFDTPVMRSGWQPNYGFSFSKFF